MDSPGVKARKLTRKTHNSDSHDKQETCYMRHSSSTTLSRAGGDAARGCQPVESWHVQCGLL